MKLVDFARPFGAALLALAMLATTPATAAEISSGDLTIAHAKARPNLPNRPAAAYMTISNAGAEDDRLLAARSESFGTIELHTVQHSDGVMKMMPVEAVEVPAGGNAVLEPGGMHLMLFDAAERFKIGDRFDAVLIFEKAGDITVTFDVKKVKHGSKKMHHGDHGSGHSGHGSDG